MNNNLGMQPNDFNNQNGAMQNQANNMQMNNQPMNNQPMNNAPMNNQTMYNQQMNNMPMNGVQIPNQPVNNANMNQQYNYGYQQPNMNTGNNDDGLNLSNVTVSAVKHSSKTLIFGGVFGVAIVAVSIVCVVLFLGKDKVSNQKSGDTIVSTPDSGLNSIPEFEYDKKGDFYMPIESVGGDNNKNAIISGEIESGSIKIGDEIQILGIRNEIVKAKVVDMYFYRANVDNADAGDKVTLYLENVKMNDIERGQVAMKTNFIEPTTKFNAYIEMVSDSGVSALNVGEQVLFNFKAVDVKGTLAAFEGSAQEIKVGENLDITAELKFPLSLKEGTQFSIEVDGKVIANGVITEVLSDETKLPNIEREIEKTPDSKLEEIPKEEKSVNGIFVMPIDDVFKISGRGTVVTGKVENGSVRIGDEIQIIGMQYRTYTTKITDIDLFRDDSGYAEIDDDIGIILDNVDRDLLERGQVVVKKDTMSAYTKFHAYIEADSYSLDLTERFQYNFRNVDITGNLLTFESGFEQVNPGDKVDVTIELIAPVAMEVGTHFTVKDNGKIIAKGVVTEVLE